MTKHFTHIYVILLLMALGSRTVYGQFTLSAEVRPRAEFRHGFKKPLAAGTDAAFFIEQRTRLNAGFTSSQFEVYLSFQDVRMWGATSQVYKSDPALANLYEAWGSYYINTRHAVTVGRMALNYDNARILGNLNWAAQGRSHDLVKYSYEHNKFKLHVGAAFNQDVTTAEPAKLAGTYYGVSGNYKTMQFVWLHKSWEHSGLSFLLLNNGVQNQADSSVHFSQTTGVYGTSTLGKVALAYDGYAQFGHDASGADISAYLLGVNATFWKSKPASLTLGVDYLSGDKNNTGTQEAFNPLYGTHHKFYGFMDYFYVGNAHAGKGLADVFAQAKFKTSDHGALLTHVHEFLAATEIVSESAKTMSSTLGTEIDLVYAATLAPQVTLNVGYSQLFYTESLEIIKGVSNPKPAAWAWVMLTLKPTLFTTKSEE